MGIIATIRIVAGLLITAIVSAGLWYITNLKGDLVQARENQVKLEQSIKSQQELIVQMKQDLLDIQKSNRELNEIAARLRGDAEALSKKFRQDATGQGRDFGTLAKARPALVESLVNRGTKNALRCLELASGAPHTKEELAARTSSEINRECPAIANPNYRPVQ